MLPGNVRGDCVCEPSLEPNPAALTAVKIQVTGTLTVWRVVTTAVSPATTLYVMPSSWHSSNLQETALTCCQGRLGAWPPAVRGLE